MLRLEELVIVPSRYCNLSCAHCCRSAGPTCSDRWSESLAQRISDWLGYDEISTLCISGGEPFIWSEKFWKRIIRTIPRSGQIDITTNGLFCEREKTRKRVVEWLLPELEGITDCIFVDLSTDEYHDHPRKGVWEDFKRECEDFCCNTSISERVGGIDHPLPLGRAHNWGSSGRVMYCSEFTGNERIEDNLTIYPDGSIRACCDGGGTVAHVLKHSLHGALLRRRKFLTFLRQKRRNENIWVPSANWARPTDISDEACETCSEWARKYFRWLDGREG